MHAPVAPCQKTMGEGEDRHSHIRQCYHSLVAQGLDIMSKDKRLLELEFAGLTFKRSLPGGLDVERASLLDEFSCVAGNPLSFSKEVELSRCEE